MSCVFYKKKIAIWLFRGRNHLDYPRLTQAISRAADNIGGDIVMPKQRDDLKKAIFINCDNGDEYPFRYLSIDFLSERDFYRRRDKFLIDIYDYIAI